MAKTSRLELEWRTRAGVRGKAERNHLDFVIDGRSLHDLLRLGDIVGCLGWLSPEADRRFARQLLLKAASELPSGRQALYICPECGDLGCGALTVHVEQKEDEFMWRDFRHESIHGGGEAADERYGRVGPFRFQAVDYKNVFARF